MDHKKVGTVKALLGFQLFLMSFMLTTDLLVRDFLWQADVVVLALMVYLVVKEFVLFSTVTKMIDEAFITLDLDAIDRVNVEMDKYDRLGLYERVLWSIFDVLQIIECVVKHDYVHIPIWIVLLLWMWWLIYRGKDERKKALKELGYKARAAKKKLVDSMPSPKPATGLA